MKSLKALLLAIIIATTITPTKSQAAIGISTGNPLLIIGGLAVPAGTFVMVNNCRGVGCIIPGLFVLGAAIGAGIILLDGEDEQLLEFSPLDEVNAEKLGVSKIEADDFNSQIDEANIILEEVALELEGVEAPTSDDVKAAWNNYRDLISENTFNVIEAIALKMAN